MKTPIELEIAKVLVPVENPQPNEQGLPYPTHEGVLDLMGKKLRVYQLNTGQAIINSEDLENFFSEFTGTRHEP